MLGEGLAICAGLCAALASTCAKLAMASQEATQLCDNTRTLLTARFDSQDPLLWIPECKSVLTLIRITFFGLIFFFNALMWTLFVKSLRKCSSSIQASMTNTASNLFFTAVLGHVIFGEVMSMLWFMGASFIILGLVLIHHSKPPEETKKDI